MRTGHSATRSVKLGPAAFVILLAGLSAACSNSTRLGQPLFTGTANQRAIIDGQSSQQALPPPLPTANAGVSQSPLPPPGQLGTPTQVASANGPFAWSAVGGKVITIGSTDTLSSLSVTYGVPQQQILSANQLSRPDQITAGRVIVIPRRVPITPEAVARSQAAETAPLVTPVAYAPEPQAPAPAPAAGAPQVHVVAAGDTLYSIARRYGRRVDQLAAINGLASPSHIRIGQRIALSGAARTPDASQALASARQVASQGPAAPAPSPAVPQQTVTAALQTPTSGALPAPAQPTPLVEQAAPQAAASLDAASDPASADGTSFRWPVRGRIISGFGEKAGGERNDGINLAVPEGTSIKAAEAGTVIYAGNELEGYGNLVLVRHADGWVSAYAHAKEIRVQRGDRIRRGQTVALAGRTGSVSTPQLHFELRRGAKPVNPLDHLSGA